MEELDYEYEAQNQRTFSRAYRGHPFIYVPDVITRLSRRRVLVTELVDGIGFEEVKQLAEEERSRFGEIVFRFCFGSIYHLQHFNADSHPGNYLLMEDGRVAFLDFGMTKKLDREQIELEQAALDAAIRKDPEALRLRLHDLGFIKKPTKLDAEHLMDHVMLVGGWYIEDGEYQVSARRVMKIIESASDPRSEYFRVMRRENIPADELMGRRMEIGRDRGAGAARRAGATGTGSCASGSTPTSPRPSSAARSGTTSSPAAVRPGSGAGGWASGAGTPMDRDHQADQGDRGDDPQAELDPADERVLDHVEDLVGDRGVELLEGGVAGLGAGEVAVDHPGLVAGHLQAGVGRLADHQVLGAAREQRRGQPEADRAAGDLEHVGDPAGEARARGVEHRHRRGRDRRVEEAGADPDQRPAPGPAPRSPSRRRRTR